MNPPRGMVTLQVWRLENHDASHFKQYTAFTDGRLRCFFGYSRIGATWQWVSKPGGDAAGRCASQIKSKRNGGYDHVWSADVTVPEPWADDPKTYGRELQDFIESQYRANANRGGVARDPGGALTTPVTTSPLGGVLDDCRDLVSKLAVDADTAIKDYPELVGRYEAAKEEMEVVDGYIETIRLMLAGAEAR